jgi:hypothetical protein
MITLAAIIRQLQKEKEALDATITAIERLVQPYNGAGSRPASERVASSKAVVARQQSRNRIS